MKNVYVFRFIEDGCVAITAVTHADDISAIGRKEMF